MWIEWTLRAALTGRERNALKNRMRVMQAERESAGCAVLRRGAALLLVLQLSAFGAGTIFASSPQFARTEEEWAALRDNRMEYTEIEGLIQEYNPTVQQNQFSYRKFRKDYGSSRDDVASEYRRLADELLADISYPDEGDANYAAAMTAALTSEMQAKNLQKQADDTLEDAEIIRLNYESAEKALVQTAQNSMIAYYAGQYRTEADALSKQLAELQLSVAEAQKAVGAGTEIQLLTTQQAVQNAEKTKISDSAARDATRQKLQVMLGWKADSEAEIAPLPELQLSRIDSMNPEADLEHAKQNNYTLRVNQKKLENAVGETDINTLKSTIADNEARIAASLNAAYQTVLSAKSSYLYSVSNAELSAQTAAQSAQRYQLGLLSRVEYETAELNAKQAELGRKQAELTLFQAMEAYDWAVRGLAGASAAG